jgi:parvulin-like peptidyl-prolyl isomerase
MQVQASHILVSTLEEAQTLSTQLTEGASFAELAKNNSKCPSNADGGNLGIFGRGQMVPSFEAAAFELPVGGISEPVQTQFGYHLIHRTA